MVNGQIKYHLFFCNLLEQALICRLSVCFYTNSYSLYYMVSSVKQSENPVLKLMVCCSESIVYN